MDQPTEDSVVPVRMNTVRNFVNKASNYNSDVDYFTHPPPPLSPGGVPAVPAVLPQCMSSNCDVTLKIM